MKVPHCLYFVANASLEAVVSLLDLRYIRLKIKP